MVGADYKLMITIMITIMLWLHGVISERAKRASSVMFVFNRDFRYVRIYMWPYVNPYAHARWYVMWGELSVDPFLNHSNQLKPTLKMF